MKNKSKNIILIIILVSIFISCKVNNPAFLHDDIFKCYCYDEEIHVYYRSPNLFENKNFADTLTKSYIKVYFPNFINDTLEIFINNKKIMDYYNNFENDVDGYIFFDYSSEKRNPIITVIPKDKSRNCMQLLIDDRYRLMFISEHEGIWYILYSNFHVPSI